MPRAIIRASINGPSPNTKMAELGKILKNRGFEHIGTGAHEGDLPSTKDLNDVIREVLKHLDSMGPGFKVDHLWIYADSTVGRG